MAREDEKPYQFKNGRWEVWNGTDWGLASPELAAILKGFTKVKGTLQSGLVFLTPAGQSISLENVDRMLAQIDEAARKRDAPWWGPEIAAAFGPYPPIGDDGRIDPAAITKALNYAQDLKLPDTPGVKAGAETLPGKYTSIGAADVAAPPGWHSVGNADGSYTLERDAPQKQYQQPSFEDEFNRRIFSGDIAGAEALWKARKRITESGGRMSDAEIAQFLTDGRSGDLFKAEEMPALIAALRRGPTAQEAAAQGPGPNGEPGNINAGGFYGPTPAPRPFPAFPDTLGTGPVPGGVGPAIPASFGPTASPDAVLQNYQAFPNTTSPGSFTEAIQGDLAAVTNAQRTQVQMAAQQAQHPESVPKSYLGMTPQQFDPNYDTASPEAQKAIEKELARRQAQGDTASTKQTDFGPSGYVPTQQDLATPAWTAAWDTWKGGLAPAEREKRFGPQSFQDAYAAQGGAGRTGSFQTAQGANPWDAATWLGQTPQGLATTAAINAVTPEARAAMAEEARASQPQAPQTPQPLSFEAALAEINQRRRQQNLLRRPQGRTIFA